ncbi:MAG TPA: DNA repair protein RadA [Microbacteriaceae bacterium]|nr:DNA repair protein RadA [Microbacteriaceae bacterium]
MARVTTAYRCTECGWTSAKWVGRCSECQAWNTVEETAPQAGGRAPAAIRPAESRVARPITSISTQPAVHWPSGIAEFDRVLGGGIVPGAAILLSGEPGVGKSTLLLEVASRSAAAGRRVLYVTAEESAGQVRLRAERTGALHDELHLAAETDLAAILGQLDAVEPALVILDSVQTVSSSLIEGLAGGTSQVREVAATITRVAKERDLPVLLVGHVTKDGSIAGPRLLEHLVDVVLQFDGDRQSALRFVRAHKNRFGPVDEVGCFEMTGDGIAEVADPSGLFMSRSRGPVSGTCLTIAIEGRRAIPVEIQALIVPSQAPNPRRVVGGLDSGRVAMLLAVLEKRGRLPLASHDVYVSTVGGIRVVEPGADLAIALAVASAARDTALPPDLAAVGEISLAGEVRKASGTARRAAEAARLGFARFLDDRSETIGAALREAFGS